MISTQAAAARADEHDARALFDAYADMVYRLALVRTRNRADAEDVLQEVFLRYLRKPPDFADAEHAKAWMLRTTIHCSITLLSSAWRRKTQPAQDVAAPMPARDDEVYRAVLDLPAKYRTAVHLYYFEGYSVAEIAQLMGSRESTVKSWLFRARAQLRDMLKGVEIDV
jgi:RNA polymerase sigma-70 factor (ECF subfamily)